MRFFNFSKTPDINQGIKQYKDTENAVLIDVRTPEEYEQGRVSDSRNIPLQEIERAAFLIKDKNTPIFVYCRSGKRSRRAEANLKRMGYLNVTNIGGINDYDGNTES